MTILLIVGAILGGILGFTIGGKSKYEMLFSTLLMSFLLFPEFESNADFSLQKKDTR